MIVGAGGSSALLRRVFRDGLVMKLGDGRDGRQVSSMYKHDVLVAYRTCLTDGLDGWGKVQTVKDLLDHTRAFVGLPEMVKNIALDSYICGFLAVTGAKDVIFGRVLVY